MQTAQRKTEYRPVAVPRKRVVKMEGNVAYINSGLAVQKPRQSVAAIKKEAAEARQTKSGVASTLFVIFVAFCAMALLVSRYAAICSIGAKNNALQKDIESVKTQIEELQIDMELRNNFECVQNVAKNKLGMIYPAEDQKVSIDISG
ncbi:MAG: hypothetical protein ACOX8Q_01330 [Christensenellales bacterium]|jgi:cell division protein FtsL